MNSCLVSVVVPVYNVEKYINKCIESVIQQTHENWELILVDDNSDDNSYQLCCEYSKKDKRIRCLKNPVKGVSNARNLGICNVQGEWILFIDSDDEIKKDAVEKLLKGRKEYDIIVGGYEIANEISNTLNIYCPDEFQGDILNFCKVIDKYTSAKPYMKSPWCKLFKTELIKKNNILFPSDMSYGEDVCFVYDYLRVAKKIKIISDVVYVYYIRGTSLSHGFRREKYQINLMLDKKLYDLCSDYGIRCYDKLMNDNRKSFLAYLNELATSKETQKNKLYILRIAANNEKTQKCYSIKLKMAIQYKIIAILLHLDAYRLLLLISWLYVKSKRAIKKI